ncbi:MAG TPA: 16S rRNA (adenine(1518)-N(6)/adenine(1519)-N(6))-dimethyltransferase, partial [Candidatus Tenderia electrophaga]|nr:16S rRNA (adenine(1518)-N(6)/adenine(1519)-N(6))-dimethyltransferase [Candidatus Tenderia electrophaga]
MSNSHQDHRARKRFGQNFLHDENVIQRIIHSVNPKPGDNIVEIGPGMGALTELLFEASNNINVVELDRDLVQRLQKRFGEKENFHIHSSDALKFDFRQ